MIKNYIKSIYLGKKYKTLIDYICSYHPKFKYETSDSAPIVKYNGITFKGFYNSSSDDRIYKSLKKYLPPELKQEYYRIVRDILTRYIFPHMIPQLKPLNGNNNTMSGFHGQHKDSLNDIDNFSLREKLIDIFTFKHDDIVINCGAYIGFGDIRVSQFIPNGRLVSLEAKKECYNLLNENISTNNISNIVPLHKAVWKKNEKINLNTGELQTNSLIFNASHFGENPNQDQTELIDAVTIDSLVDQLSLPKVDFVSLTLNGAEVDAIEGMKEVINKFSPRIRLAGWYQRDNIPIWKHCSNKLKPFGYNVVVGKHGSLYAFK